MKLIKNVIGQPQVKQQLNDIIIGRNYALKNNKPFIFPPIAFTGPTGCGKTHYGEAFADALKDEGFRFEEVPINSGWRYFGQLAERVCQVAEDDERGASQAIPAVILVDEAHEKSPIINQIKLITNINQPRMFERNGVKFFADPHNHAWMFASNEELDPALKRRCIEIPFMPYDRGEKKQLISLMCEKKLDENALEYIETRTKPMAGDIKNACRILNLQPVDRVTLAVAKTVVKHLGLFPQGLVKKDLELMIRMAGSNRPVPIEALKAKIQDVKTTTTRSRLGMLQSLDLCETARGGYKTTKLGLNYLKKVEELQKGKKK